MFIIAGKAKTGEEVFWVPVTHNSGIWSKSVAPALKFFHPAQAERFLKRYIKTCYPEAYVKEL
jgi:hypothetical protein